MDSAQILVAGASGFVGRRLVPALVAAGHDVRAMTRRLDAYDGPGFPVLADVTHEDEVHAALHGCTIAYYLIHALDHSDFRVRDVLAAQTFARAARRAGVERIVYLGGLGNQDDDLSEHLRSRQEVEGVLGAEGVPVTTLRAGIVVGDGGASWEIIRSLVQRVPVLAVPRWAYTLSQPIAVDDVVRYLVGIIDVHDHRSLMFEIGGAEVLRYVDVLSRVNALEGRPGLIVPVPVASRRLANLVAAQALPLITGVDSRTIRTLLESMRNEVVVRDDRIRQVVPFEPMGYDDAVLAALAERSARGARPDRQRPRWRSRQMSSMGTQMP